MKWNTHGLSIGVFELMQACARMEWRTVDLSINALEALANRHEYE